MISKPVHERDFLSAKDRDLAEQSLGSGDPMAILVYMSRHWDADA